MNILRCSPWSDHTRLLQCDLSLRRGLCYHQIWPNIQLKQANLPGRACGFGIRLVATLASFPFLASAARTRDLQSHILLNCLLTPEPYVDPTIMLWFSVHNIPLLDDTSASNQHTSDAFVIAFDKASILSSLTNNYNRTRWLPVDEAIRFLSGCASRSNCLNLVSIVQVQRRQIYPSPPTQWPDLANSNTSQHPIGRRACSHFPFGLKAPQRS